MSGESESEEVGPIAHHNVAVLQTRDRAEMDTIVGTPALRGLIWRRLDDTHALVDPTAVLALNERLVAIGVNATVGELHASEA